MLLIGCWTGVWEDGREEEARAGFENGEGAGRALNDEAETGARGVLNED